MDKKAKILIYDIETSPIIGYTWGVWQTDVVQVIEDWQILSVAWKWLGESKVHCVGQDDFKDYVPGVNNDKNVVDVIHKLFDEADIVIAHNGNKFDQRKVTARMIIHGMKPPSPYKQIDTKLVAKRYAAFTRNNLKWLAKDLNVAQKGDPGGIETWQGCMAGDKKAWKLMKQYNKQDIPPLEEIYLKLRPWISNHPNIGRIEDTVDACPKCGGTSIQSRGKITTSVSAYRRYTCNDCGAWLKGRLAIPADEDNKPTYTNISG